MGRSAITTAILVFLIVADVSNASRLRYSADESPTKNDTTAAMTPSSPSPTKKSDPKPDSPSNLDPKSVNRTDSVTPPPDDKKDPKLSHKPEKVTPSPHKEKDSGNNSILTSNSTNHKTMEDNEEKKRNIDSGKIQNSTETEQGAVSKEDKNKKKNNKTNEDKNDSQSVIAETCDGVANSCKDESSLTACIKNFGTGSKELVVLVHNGGKTLKVNLAASLGEAFSKGLEVAKQETRKINVSLTFSNSKLVLSAGNGDCVLLVNPLVSEGNFFVNLPSYDKLLTPVNGAYFLIATVVIFGGSWAACCMFRKRRRQHDGVPYQELEMGLPESVEGTEVETAEGWDQVWDDDWDEDKAVKSPGGRHVLNISANGLTSRSSNRDGWENDWDD